jgi:hypothetical protein
VWVGGRARARVWVRVCVRVRARVWARFCVRVGVGAKVRVRVVVMRTAAEDAAAHENVLDDEIGLGLAHERDAHLVRGRARVGPG